MIGQQEEINLDEYNFDHKYHLDSVSIEVSNSGVEITKNYIKKNGRHYTVKHSSKDYKNDIRLLYDLMEIELKNKEE